MNKLDVMNAMNSVILDLESAYSDKDLFNMNAKSVKELIIKQMKSSKPFFKNIVSLTAKKANATELEVLAAWGAK